MYDTKLRPVLAAIALALYAALASLSALAEGPSPLIEQGEPVDWWLVFKLGSG